MPAVSRAFSPTRCEWCMSPSKHCPLHDPNIVPYREPDSSSVYNELSDGTNPTDAGGGELSTRLPDSTIFAETEFVRYRDPSLYNEVIDSINPSDAGGGESSTAENHRLIVASVAQVAASNRRRKTGSGRFPCTLCPQTFTAKHNLQSQSHSAPLKFRTY